MRIRRKFLQLTKQTIPHGDENLLEKHLPSGWQKDEFDNYYLSIGDNYTTMFTCHLDTASRNRVQINHRFEENIIKTDGTTILGADDKAGMIVLLYLIEKKVPGLYYFFVGEEVGCVGSQLLASDFKYSNIKKVISFDRRGTTSIITHQIFGRCCSDEFAITLSQKLSKIDKGLKLSPDDTGLITDSAQFIELVPECTNISVGYYNEHTVSEMQDIEYLRRLCFACSKIDWESLPVKRNLDSADSECDEELDLDFDNLIEGEQITIEKKLIFEFLKKQDYSPKSVIWNGEDCWCDVGDSEYVYIGSREELSYFIDEL